MNVIECLREYEVTLKPLKPSCKCLENRISRLTKELSQISDIFDKSLVLTDLRQAKLNVKFIEIGQSLDVYKNLKVPFDCGCKSGGGGMTLD